MTELESLKNQYNEALDRFEEILSKEKNDIVRDSAIKRFEIIFDLAWKLLKEHLEVKKGILCSSPKECFREGYRREVIDYDELWLDMTDWRNSAVHTYSQKFADILYARLPETLNNFKIIKDRLQ